MNRTWQIDQPTTQELGGVGDPPRSVTVILLGGRLDVVEQPGRATIGLDVQSVAGRPISASWQEGNLRLEHHKDSGSEFLQMVKGFITQARSTSARITLTVPAGVRLTANTVGAEVLVGGVSSDVSVNTVSGRVGLSHLAGRVDAKTVSSAIEAAHLSGELKAKSVSGRLTVNASPLRSAKIATVSGAALLDLSGSGALVTASGVSAEITVRIPRDSGFDVTANSQSGHVVVDGRTLSGGPGKTTGGHHASGDRSFAMKLRSVSGNVVVLRDGDPAGSASSGYGSLATPLPEGIQDLRPSAGIPVTPPAGAGGQTLWPSGPGGEAGTPGTTGEQPTGGSSGGSDDPDPTAGRF